MIYKKSVIGLCSAVFFMMLGVGMIVALLPQRIIAMNGSVSAVGCLTAAFAIPYILLQVPYGTLSDKWGYKYFLIWGYLLCSLTGMLYYYSRNVNLVFLGRFFQGMGESPIWALAPALLSLHYPTAKGKMMGMYNASIHLGLTLGPVLGILCSRMWQGNEPFLFYAIVCLLGGTIVHITVKNPHVDRIAPIQNVNYKNVRTLVANRERLVVLNGIMLYGAGYAIFLTVIPAFLIRVKGFGQTFTGLVFTLFYIAISVSQLCTGPLSDKMGRKLFMIYGLSIAAISLALFSGCKQPWISLLLFLASLGLGGFSLSSMALLNESVSDSLKGTISGAYYLFWGLGYFSGPLIISKIIELIGFQTSFSLFSGLLIGEIILLVLTVKSPAKLTLRGRENDHVEQLMAKLRHHPDWSLREKAAKALSDVDDARATESLIQALGDPVWEVQRSAAEALGKRRDIRAIGALIQTLGNTHKPVKLSAIEALVSIGIPAVEPLLETLETKKPDIRKGIVMALGQIRDVKAVMPFIHLLKEEKSWAVRNKVVWALGEIGDVLAIEALLEMLQHSTGEIREIAVEALRKLGVPAEEALLVDLLKDQKQGHRELVGRPLKEPCVSSK